MACGGTVGDRLGWERIAKARLSGGRLTVTGIVEVAVWADGTSVVRDAEPVEYRFERPNKVTDQVHTRVRRSVAASRHLPWPGGGGWVVLRRMPGRDGLHPQVRLDPGADPAAPGFAQAVAAVAVGVCAEPNRQVSPVLTTHGRPMHRHRMTSRWCHLSRSDVRL